MHEDIAFFSRQPRRELYVELAGITYCDGNYWIRRDKPATYVFEYVVSGTGTLRVDDAVCTVRGGDVYFVPGWRRQYYASSAADPWVKHWINVSGPLVENLTRIYGIEDHYLFPGARKPGEMLMHAVETLRNCRELDEVYDFAEPFLLDLIRELSRHLREDTHPEEDRDDIFLRRFLMEHISKPMPSLDEIAGAINRSRVQTIRIFRNANNCTPYEFLLNEKARAAAELLRNTRIPIKAVAGMVGFEDEYYFSRFFKRRVGVSPRLYRNRANTAIGIPPPPPISR